MQVPGFTYLNNISLNLMLLLVLCACSVPIQAPEPQLGVDLRTPVQVLPEVSLSTVELAVDSPAELSEQQARLASQQREVGQLCEEVGGRLGSVSVTGCLSHGLLHSGQYSTDGRALVYKDYFSSSDSAAKILVVGGIHGDEYSSFSLLFRWLERLDKHVEYQNNWRLLPLSNPDGLLSFRPARRTNANGVDLNRNFNTLDWEDKALRYWRDKTASDKRRNPGAKAESEVETRWLSETIETWRPDIIVAVHAPYGILDFDSPQPERLKPPEKIGILHLNLLGTYPGSLGRYGAKDRNIPVLTLELPHAGIMPSQQQQQDLWWDLQLWLAQNLSK